jgi:uncharacterized membrane-anchored protein YitT (DUF2179 family)
MADQTRAINALFITAGVLSAGMGLKGFLFSSHFIDGGVTGISMLLWKVTQLPLSLWLPLVNLPFIALGYRHLGRAFAVRSVLAIGALAVVLAVVHFPDVTHDSLLTAVFGGVFLGAGIGLAVRGGAVLDGTEIAALLIGKRSPVLKVGDVILGFNVVLFLTAMSVLGIEPALYSILTYVAAARTLDFILHGIEEFTAMTIMSAAPQEIRTAILEQMGRDPGLGARRMTGDDREILHPRGDAPRDRPRAAHRRHVRRVGVRRAASAGGRPRRDGAPARDTLAQYLRPIGIL